MDENKQEYDVYTLTDEEGNESEFVLIGETEKKGKKYVALIPAAPEEDTEYLEYVILRRELEDGEEVLVSIDDDDEYDDIADYFDDLFADEIDCDADAK